MHAGKTCLLTQFVENRFDHDVGPTIGTMQFEKKLKVDGMVCLSSSAVCLCALLAMCTMHDLMTERHEQALQRDESVSQCSLTHCDPRPHLLSVIQVSR